MMQRKEKVAKTVAVEVVFKEGPDTSGLWELGYEPHESYGFIWGLTYGGRLTHMSYGGNYADPKRIVDEELHRDRFYFDAGGNGRPVWVERAELKRALGELGLLEDAA